jgi:NADPH:quinone reductase-like Zn-dependent oxidoreductase
MRSPGGRSTLRRTSWAGQGFEACSTPSRQRAATSRPARSPDPEVSLDLRTLYLKHLELIGSTLGTRAEFETLVGHIASGRLKPLLAATYPLHDLPQAQADFLAKGFFGKLVVAP